MHYLPHLASLALMTGFLTGCAQWVKPGVPETVRDADLAACEAGAYREIAPNVITYQSSAGYYEEPSSKCEMRDGKRVCTRIGGRYHEPTFSEKDVNSGARDSLIADCMYKRGYILK
jgi:hypothetical protein